MKRTLTLIVFLLSVLALTAQNQPLFISGTVTNISNGNPIPNHEVIIQSDSNSGTPGYFYHTVITSNNGYYFDSIPLQPAFNSGQVIIRTLDCQGYYNVVTLAFGPGNYNIIHDFVICDNYQYCQANFAAAPQSQSPQTIDFLDLSTSSTGSIIQWNWYFGDGNATTVNFPLNPNISHTYATPGTYNVCLTIVGSDSLCYNTYCSTIVVAQGSGPCIANFTYTDSLYTMNHVHFTDLSQSSGGVITSWLWNFGDPGSGTNNTSTVQNPDHLYTQPGIYNVCLTIQGADSSCFDMTCQTIAVGSSGVCIADFTYTSSPSTQTPVQFTDLSTTSGSGIVSWSWDFGDPQSGINNTSAMQNPSHTFSQVGNYTVCLSFYSADSCFDVSCQTIYVGNNAGCQAYFTYAVDSLTVPPGTPVRFFDLSQGYPTQWSWSFGDGTASTEQNPTHYYAANGTYTVCLTIFGDSCQDSYCKTVQIGNVPGCSSYFVYTNTYLSVNFQGFILNNNIPQWGTFIWSFGDGTAGQGQNVNHTYTATGSYPVTLTASDSLGCTSTYTEIITLYDSINTHQVYGQVYGGDFPITSGFVMIFSLDSTANYSPYVSTAIVDSMGVYYFTMVPDGNYYIYAIPILPDNYLPTYYGDVLGWQDATVIQLGQANNPYDIHLLPANTYAGGSGTINGQINMGTLKSTVVDKVTMILMNSDMLPINFYKVNTAGDFTFPTLSYGTYYLRAEIPGVTSDVVKVVISQATPVVSVTMTFSGNRILGLNDSPASIVAGNLYPNPASDVVYLSLNMTRSMQVQIDVYNMAGQAVIHSEKALNQGSTIIPIGINSLPRGIYTVRVHSDEGTNIVRKLSK